MTKRASDSYYLPPHPLSTTYDLPMIICHTTPPDCVPPSSQPFRIPRMELSFAWLIWRERAKPFAPTQNTITFGSMFGARLAGLDNHDRRSGLRNAARMRLVVCHGGVGCHGARAVRGATVLRVVKAADLVSRVDAEHSKQLERTEENCRRGANP